MKHKIVSNQVRYSLIERTVGRDLLNYCQRNGSTLIAYSPFGSRFVHSRRQILKESSSKWLKRL